MLNLLVKALFLSPKSTSFAVESMIFERFTTPTDLCKSSVLKPDLTLRFADFCHQRALDTPKRATPKRSGKFQKLV
jgi:hypothetical protein